MGTVPTGDLDLENLSSNWRKLQRKLKPTTGDQTKKQGQQNPAHRVQKNRSLPFSKRQSSPPTPFHKNKPDMGLGWSRARREAPSASLALWAEDHDISAKDLAEAYGTSSKSASIAELSTAPENINEGLSDRADIGKYLAIDCEMVGVGPAPDNESALARVSIVNYHGQQIYDSFVQPKEAVTDYRTPVSGITPELLQIARTFEVVQKDVANLLNDKILIGHAVHHDLDALLLGHPKRDIRDTSKHPAFRQISNGRTPGLKRLARELLGVDIQGGEHSSIEDARATMLLFRRDKERFDREHEKKWGPDRIRMATNKSRASSQKSKGGRRTKKDKT